MQSVLHKSRPSFSALGHDSEFKRLLHTSDDAGSFHRFGRAVKKIPQQFAQVRHVIVDDLHEQALLRIKGKVPAHVMKLWIDCLNYLVIVV